MTHALTKPGGWADGETITGAQITAIDEKTFTSLDKTGDTVEEATITFDGFSSLTFENGSTLDGYATVAGQLTFAASRWPSVTSRTVTRCGPPVLIGTTWVDDEQNAVPFRSGTMPPGIKFLASVDPGRKSWLAIPGIEAMNGNALVSVAVRKYVLTGGTSGTPVAPTYYLTRYSNSTATQLYATSDIDQTWTNGTISTTTIPASPALTIDLSSFRYTIEVEHPYNAGVASSMHVYELIATYTATTIRL